MDLASTVVAQLHKTQPNIQSRHANAPRFISRPIVNLNYVALNSRFAIYQHYHTNTTTTPTQETALTETGRTEV